MRWQGRGWPSRRASGVWQGGAGLGDNCAIRSQPNHSGAVPFVFRFTRRIRRIDEPDRPCASALISLMCLPRMRFHFSRAILVVAAAVGAWLGSIAPATAQATPNPPGFRQQASAGGRMEEQVVTSIRFSKSRGQPLSMNLPAGPFKVRWLAELIADPAGAYTIAISVRGTFHVRVDAELVLEGSGDTTVQTLNKTLTLSKGAHRVDVVFASDDTEDTELSVSWLRGSAMGEPLGPSAFRVPFP